MSFWAIACPEVHVTCPSIELWRIWAEQNCVAVGWPPEQGFHLEGGTEPWQETPTGTERLRNAIRRVQPGDTVIPFLMNNRLGTPGDVIRSAVGDREWEATISRGCYDFNSVAELGRRIIVNWWRDGMPGTQVVLIPPEARPHGLRAAITRLSDARFKQFISMIRERRNWIDYQPRPLG
jgi:hypothetical protein